MRFDLRGRRRSLLNFLSKLSKTNIMKYPIISKAVMEIRLFYLFFLRTSIEYLTRYGQESVFKIRFQGSVEITDPCLYFSEYSPDVLKNKKKVLDIFNTDKKCLMKINIESSPPEIWIRICFLEINGSPSLLKSYLLILLKTLALLTTFVLVFSLLVDFIIFVQKVHININWYQHI